MRESPVVFTSHFPKGSALSSRHIHIGIVNRLFVKAEKSEQDKNVHLSTLVSAPTIRPVAVCIPSTEPWNLKWKELAGDKYQEQ